MPSRKTTAALRRRGQFGVNNGLAREIRSWERRRQNAWLGTGKCGSPKTPLCQWVRTVKLRRLTLGGTEVRINASRRRAMSRRPPVVNVSRRHGHSRETTTAATGSPTVAGSARVSLITLIPLTLRTMNHAPAFHFRHRSLREAPGAGP